MLIIQENKDDLTFKCVDLISKTFVELGQAKPQEEIALLAQTLADDLKRDFKSLEIKDIQEAFSRGTRETDLFVIKPRTWYTWIKTYRNLLWSAEYEVRTMNRDPKEVPFYKDGQKLIK